ncbi:hypothetical protein RHMOL_Rhmol03G0123000 [Rhododendron molle]|nr:hypothetical protein RHMOL_Rhmol03G0123000 [Rhododendron molle]
MRSEPSNARFVGSKVRCMVLYTLLHSTNSKSCESPSNPSCFYFFTDQIESIGFSFLRTFQKGTKSKV